MLSEVIVYLNALRGNYGDGRISLDDVIENARSNGSRGGLFMLYKKSVGGDFMYSYADFFRDLADRAVSLWGLSEGTNPIRVGKDSPKCHGGFGRGAEHPIYGSVGAVVAEMFAIKMESQTGGSYRFHPATKAALKERLDWGEIESSDGIGVSRMAAVYYSGRIFITRDRDLYRQILNMAESASD